MPTTNHGLKMQERRRRLLSDLARTSAGVELSSGYTRNRLVRLALATKGERRDTLTDLGRRLLGEGVHSTWFDDNEDQLTQRGGG